MPSYDLHAQVQLLQHHGGKQLLMAYVSRKVSVCAAHLNALLNQSLSPLVSTVSYMWYNVIVTAISSNAMGRVA